MIKEIRNKLPRDPLARQIARLNLIAGSASNAYKLGPQVKKLELVLLSKNIWTKSAGLKKFWSYHLPTLKFHNSDVDFVVTRIKPAKKEDYDKVPCAVLVHSEEGQTKLSCENKDMKTILKDLVRATNATKIPEKDLPLLEMPTPQ